MPKIHCVVGKRHGDVARWTTELIQGLASNTTCWILAPVKRALQQQNYLGDYLG